MGRGLGDKSHVLHTLLGHIHIYGQLDRTSEQQEDLISYADIQNPWDFLGKTAAAMIYIERDLSLLLPIFCIGTRRRVPSSSALIPMSICTLQCLFSHSFTTYE
jgi:hypothetical protein